MKQLNSYGAFTSNCGNRTNDSDFFSLLQPVNKEDMIIPKHKLKYNCKRAGDKYYKDEKKMSAKDQSISPQRKKRLR